MDLQTADALVQIAAAVYCSLMTYRPVTDMWVLARPKVKRYGAYLSGFPERARYLLGVTVSQPVLHVCGGLARRYPYAGGFGPHDKTLDLDPDVNPDFLQCVSQPLPSGFAAMLADPPYSETDAEEYPPGAGTYPNPNDLMAAMVKAVGPGRRAGMIHYVVPRCPKDAKFVACIGVFCGFNNKIRAFSVFENRCPGWQDVAAPGPCSISVPENSANRSSKAA